MNLRLYCYFITFVTAAVIMSCSNYSRIKSRGMVVCKSRIYNNDSGGYVLPNYFRDKKILFADSAVIQESIRVYINTDTAGVETWRVNVEHYTYCDLKQRVFYEYDTLTANASLIRKYHLPDSLIPDGCWNFYAYRSVMPQAVPENLPDTVINSIIYKRLVWHSTIDFRNKTSPHIFVAYMRCDKKNSIFHYDRAFDEKYNCNVNMFEFITVGQHQWYREELEYNRDYLTPHEQQVFAAWERNAKANPVTAADTLKRQ